MVDDYYYKDKQNNFIAEFLLITFGNTFYMFSMIDY